MTETMRERAAELVVNFQCPGCIRGPMETGCFRKDDSNESCSNHRPSTFIGGIGRIMLGLPKGFNRCGPTDLSLMNSSPIRIFREMPTYDRLNVPVWATETDGCLLVRVFMPRLGMHFVDIIDGAKLADLPSEFDVQNVAEFVNEID